MRALLLPLVAAVMPGAESPAPGGSLTLDELLRHMATTRGVVAEFREEKRLALLEAPLQRQCPDKSGLTRDIYTERSQPGDEQLLQQAERLAKVPCLVEINQPPKGKAHQRPAMHSKTFVSGVAPVYPQ